MASIRHQHCCLDPKGYGLTDWLECRSLLAILDELLSFQSEQMLINTNEVLATSIGETLTSVDWYDHSISLFRDLHGKKEGDMGKAFPEVDVLPKGTSSKGQVGVCDLGYGVRDALTLYAGQGP